MKRLKWWFRVVGGLYILLGIGFVPAINAARLPMILSGFDAPIGGIAYHGLLDFTFMFGLDLIVIGAYMLWASRNPGGHLSVVWLVVALEIVRGILDDVYMILQGYTAPFYLGFTLIHLIIIATGVFAVSNTQTEARVRRVS